MPDEENVARRAGIRPFGRALAYETVPAEVVEFRLCTTESVLPEMHAAAQTGASGAYVPPAIARCTVSAHTTEVSVRVSNIPLRLTNREVYDLFMEKCGRNCFTRSNLVYDKEKRDVSRGIAYVRCENKEKAAEFARIAMGIVVDNLKFCVEILQDR